MDFISDTFHVCINTHNFERSFAFYQALGFTGEGQLNVETDTIKMHYLKHPGTGALVEIIRYKGKDASTAPPPVLLRKERKGLNHFGFFVEDITPIRETLIAHGASIIEEASREAYEFIFAAGPDNELIGFACMKKQ